VDAGKLKTLLEQFTKPELLAVFSNLKLKAPDKKEVWIEVIIEAGLSDEKIEALEKVLADKEKEPVEEVVEEPVAPVYIVVHQIREDGKHFKIGSEYTGRFVKRFLKHGQIKVK
jgi:hypothetical protein